MVSCFKNIFYARNSLCPLYYLILYVHFILSKYRLHVFQYKHMADISTAIYYRLKIKLCPKAPNCSANGSSSLCQNIGKSTEKS